ncbi:MAG: peroxide stress protein YaaA [Rhodothermales bacterium]|nr:peroxide stress protein YaaA [Rhodothermales bacterium]MBO6778260.1 peroxide stress protein YaaA [Rhodothermales bacterium]
MPDFSILLPASGPKTEGGNPFAPDMFDYRSSNTFNYFHALNADRRSLIDALHAAMDGGVKDPDALFGRLPDGIDGEEVNRSIYKAPLMSALDRYGPGVMYKAMDFPGLPTGAQRRLLEEGIILSGLFGLLRPDDLIPRYMLGIDANVPGMGPVMEYWKPRITPALNETVSKRLLWNLLPESFDDAWDNEMTYKAMVRVTFLRNMGGEMKVVEDQVPLRGRLVNFIVRETLEELEPLLSWRHPDGYTYDEERSSYDKPTRTHHIAMVRH